MSHRHGVVLRSRVVVDGPGGASYALLVNLHWDLLPLRLTRKEVGLRGLEPPISSSRTTRFGQTKLQPDGDP